ncbi:rhodanese-like/PpiC domain-containing protein 12, chloroplastic [Benincasa hispida]|uniref:rhodanese-like/PpiC domain-containing protein 12, chloroplastic n=1 Tax=Benincasa hispida TaxID=102211 RepID=UPI0018FF82C0|nr:rhodanese-like/PpiC domain-containing protein 12, chloroplastic [Benincasa hispida]
MLRCSRLPPLASPVFNAVRQCWMPALCVSHHSNLYSASIYASFCSYVSKSFKHVQPLWIRPMPLHHPSYKVTASISSAGGSGDSRELLVQHLLVKEDDIKLLLDLQQRIAGGEDLSDLAVEYSVCPSKEEGGMLGWVRKGQMVPEFEEAAFNAPLNKVVKCKTKFGWHLLQVLSEREQSVLLEIQPEELHLKMQDPNFLNEAQLIDVREPEEVDQASLPAFQVLPLRQFGSWGPEVTTKFDPQKDTYVMCHHGVRSLQVARYLQTQGFKNVYNVSGGIHAYSLKVDPSIPTY